MAEPMTPDADPSLLDRLGGPEAVRRWVDHFYDAIAQDPVLAPLFPADLTLSREKQFAFFVQLLGGPPLYNERFGRPFLRYLHRKVRIGQRERDAWMARLLESLGKVTDDAGLIAEVERKIGPIADHMINHHPERKDALYFN
jgi:hemoglobin